MSNRRTLENTAQINLRISQDKAAAFHDAHARLKDWVPKGELMDRAIDLLIAELKKNKELSNGKPKDRD